MEGNRRKKKSKAVGCIVVVVVIIAIIAAAGIALMSKLADRRLGTGSADQTIEVEIPEGSNVDAIASILEENGVVDSAFHFKFLCKLSGEGADFKFGNYAFPGNAEFYDITEKLNSGETVDDSVHITIKEGMWLSEIAQTVAETGLCTAEEFMAAADSRDYDYDFINDIPDRDNLLEGYLYPETYYVPKDADAHMIVDIMLKQFDTVCSENGIYADTVSVGRSLDDIVIIASLIESEVKKDDERTLVSSVIYNRLDEGIKLQIDASVIYAMGERTKRVYYADLEREDGHNTYYVDGLPVGPICSPRGASLKAAAEPADTDYLYYVVDNADEGSHYFTADYDDFLSASEKYKSTLN